MKRFNIFITLFLVLNLLFISCNNGSKRNLYPEELIGGFELLPSEQTGIDFNNSIKESKRFHHYFFSQIYLGSGVAIGDINNDGLPDVFFGGNQVNDRLYLNKGNLKFDDITIKSKAAVNPGWTWGVTMADVNSDGYLDIYVSRNGNSFNLKDRRNQLYINNQDLTFTESAIAYGLADIGFSTEAVFFDMDNDGDLDMYQVNQPADKKLLITNKISKKDINSFKDRLYLNDNGVYKDVSERAGISRELAYGLSVSASDFNNDGWVDLYIANDYDAPDFMYYNSGDGTFRNVINEELKHITQLSMGTDTGDINNDGFIDLMTTDMTPEDHYRSKTNMASMSTEAFNMMVDAGGQYQYMTNTLQVNSGLGGFSDIGNLAGVSSTDWSWSSLIVDLDNDGFKDIIVSNGIKKDVDNNDYRIVLETLDKDQTTIDNFFQLSKDAPSQPISNYAFKNNGNFKFEKVAKDWSFNTPSFSSGMAYGDLDNDGDLDVVVNNMESEAFVYRNNATGNFLKIKLEGPNKNTFGYGAKAIITHNGQTQIAENSVTRGYLSSVEPNLFFGLGKDTQVDNVEVIWTDGKSNIYNNVRANDVITAKYSNSKIYPKTDVNSQSIVSKLKTSDYGFDFVHKENEYDEYKEQVLQPHNISQNGPLTAVGDVNGDKIEDFFIGGPSGQSGILYLQDEEGQFIKNKSQPWEGDKLSEDLGVLFLDVDNDGDNDIYIASGGSEFKQGDTKLKDRLYINDGNGNFVKNNNAIPNIYQSSQCVKSSDIDQDGDLDLFVGTRLIQGQYGFPATSYLLINDNGIYSKASSNIASSLDNIGMVTDAVFTDVDNDSDDDLIVVGEWMTITVLTNNKGNFENTTSKYGLDDTRGIWWSITKSDLDNDGDDDYIIGNLGKNNKFKASKEYPFKVYANDFDNNGTNDVVLAKFYKDDYVPLRGRECTSEQMPYVAEKFKDYNSFASSKLLDILPEDKVDDAIVYEIYSFESIVLINDKGILKRQSLPIQAQFSPIKSSLVMDFNRDGFNDIITVGNHYGVEVETTRYDAGFGTVLLGNGSNDFEFISPLESGFYVPSDSRDIQIIERTDKNNLIVISNNNGPLTLFEK
ncbi:MAG: VCBS repeat-containing protein [Winogradskyella sp.]|uniref:VCBS repeat-containing protein n=1 Tax=Winogradskyella sp. TaxID=1883156 RepID=UPI0017C5B6FB|nr:VCBS repeat-containing protein [Winogradskyella sp.]MBT8245053.1 VCBS repeat-containing protein [Winogradskyella sp.]NNK22105.1 VCBS repeat-containing protein [Winogradskyella sp.]